jgi:hypothetical protein
VRSREGLVCLIYRRITYCQSVAVTCLTTLHQHTSTPWSSNTSPATSTDSTATPRAQTNQEPNNPHTYLPRRSPSPGCPTSNNPSPRHTITRRRGTPTPCFPQERSGRLHERVPRGGSIRRRRRRRRCRPRRRLVLPEAKQASSTWTAEGNRGVIGCAVRGRRLGERCAMRRRMCMLLFEQEAVGNVIASDAHGGAY